jgi:hypothetical protein
MNHLYESLTFSGGVLLMAITSYATLSNLFQQTDSNTIIVGGSGDVGAVISMLVFAIGSFLAVYALLIGVNTRD